MGTSIPEWVMAETRRQSPPVLTRHLEGIDPVALPQQSGRENLLSGILYLMASKTAAERARYLKDVMLLPKGKMTLLYGESLPTWKQYIHYLLRPLRLLLKDSLPAMKFVMRR